MLSSVSFHGSKSNTEKENYSKRQALMQYIFSSFDWMMAKKKKNEMHEIAKKGMALGGEG